MYQLICYRNDGVVDDSLCDDELGGKIYTFYARIKTDMIHKAAKVLPQMIKEIKIVDKATGETLNHWSIADSYLLVNHNKQYFKHIK